MKAKEEISEETIKMITETANSIIDKRGHFVHIEEWHTRIVIETLLLFGDAIKTMKNGTKNRATKSEKVVDVGEKKQPT